MFMKKPLDVVGDKTMEIAGDKARRAIENFMKAFRDYEIEHIVADLQVKIRGIQGTLQIKMKKQKEEDKQRKNSKQNQKD